MGQMSERIVVWPNIEMPISEQAMIHRFRGRSELSCHRPGLVGMGDSIRPHSAEQQAIRYLHRSLNLQSRQLYIFLPLAHFRYSGLRQHCWSLVRVWKATLSCEWNRRSFSMYNETPKTHGMELQLVGMPFVDQ